MPLPRPPTTPTHDTLLVAASPTGRLSTADRSRRRGARRRLRPLCAPSTPISSRSRAATRAMPTPARPRDYQLTPADAARLRPAGWRRWIAAIGSARDTFSRPLAVGLTTLGLAGLSGGDRPIRCYGLGQRAGSPRPRGSGGGRGAWTATALVSGGGRTRRPAHPSADAPVAGGARHAAGRAAASTSPASGRAPTAVPAPAVDRAAPHRRATRTGHRGWIRRAP